MLKWFYNMGLRNKFYLMFGSLIVAVIVGVAIGQCVVSPGPGGRAGV